MMRGLVIATNGDMRVQTFTAPALEDVQKVVGGYVETVTVRNIRGHYQHLHLLIHRGTLHHHRIYPCAGSS